MANLRIKPYTKEDTLALMDLQTGIDIMRDLTKVTNDLNNWYQQYKYVTIYGNPPDMPLFKGVFVEVLTRLNMYADDYKQISKHFEKTLRDYNKENNQTNQLTEAI